ncbi:MAG: type II secretion system F family protein, partial [Acidimicrobiia bacterium]
MTAFVVTYSTRSGQRREMTLNAASPSEARRELRRRGILANTVVRQDAPSKPQGTPKKPRSSFAGLAEMLDGP